MARALSPAAGGRSPPSRRVARADGRRSGSRSPRRARSAGGCSFGPSARSPASLWVAAGTRGRSRRGRRSARARDGMRWKRADHGEPELAVAPLPAPRHHTKAHGSPRRRMASRVQLGLSARTCPASRRPTSRAARPGPIGGTASTAISREGFQDAGRQSGRLLVATTDIEGRRSCRVGRSGSGRHGRSLVDIAVPQQRPHRATRC